MPPDAKAPTPKKVKKSTPAPAGPRDSGVQSDANRAPAPRKVRKAKPAPVATPTRAPVSDVRSSGPNYDAKQRAKVKPKPAGNLNSGHRVTGTVHAGTKSSGGLGGLAAVPLSGARLIVHANPTRAALSAINLAATAAHAPGAGVIRRVAGDAEKVTKSIPGDAAELAVTTPSSLYKLGDTVAHGHVKQAAKMLVQPYGQLVRHPEKFVTTHPVTTALMVEPAARVPGRAAGAALRAAGKQTLEREPATLPGSALKVTRVKSRDAFVNKMQTRADAKNPPPTISDKPGTTVKGIGKNAKDRTVLRSELEQRTDEFYDFAKKQKARVRDHAAKQAKDMGLSKDDGAAHIDAIVGGAKRNLDRRFAKEFGATWYRDSKTGALIKPKNAAEGRLYKTKAEADHIASKVPFDAVVRPAGKNFSVVPRTAAERYARHSTVGTSPSAGAAVLRSTGKAFRTAVLPLSPKWLAGQGAEAGLRSAVAGAGPTSFIRAGRVVKAMDADRAGAGKELLMRTMGGQFDLTGTAREFSDGTKTLADEFSKTSLASPTKAISKAADNAPLRAVRKGWAAYTNVVFNTINGAIEHTAQKAMLGKAIKQSPLMEKRLIGLSDEAIHEAAQGLRGTETQVHLARQVDRMYGQYAKFGPDKREALLHWTPFYPWYRNVATFLLKVLPVDHPVYASLTASLDAATEDWRKAHHLSLRGKGSKVPAFLMGSGPAGGDAYTRIGRYMPFAPAGSADSLAGLPAPQLVGPLQNLLGTDWKGAKIKGNDKDRVLNALLTAAEEQVPGVSQIGNITGLSGHYVRKDGKPSVVQGKSIGPAIVKYLNPVAPTKSAGGSDPVVASGPALDAKKGRTVVRRSAGPVARRKVTRRTTVVRRTP